MHERSNGTALLLTGAILYDVTWLNQIYESLHIHRELCKYVTGLAEILSILILFMNVCLEFVFH
jgi:hypothetical protein